MTGPLDLDALAHGCPANGDRCPICALIAEVEATRTQRDQAHEYVRWMREDHAKLCPAADLKARAERAEARLRDLGWSANQEEAHGERLDVLWAERQEYIARAERAEAAVARAEAVTTRCADCECCNNVRAALRGEHA